MQRDHFTCQNCGDAKTELNVDHAYYEFGLQVWEYPDESLRTFCKPCHAAIGDASKWIRRFVGSLNLDELKRAVGFLRCPRIETSEIMTDRSKILDQLKTADHDEAIGLLRRLQESK